ncbi:hypothetical protein SAMN06295909_3120 [Plantibacter sp. VKM Ac-1784]|uniref:Tip attachment protein J domain-containing protein n=1 Tax=Plantibacter elymi (nom. nud.) TaxID=199708 RepID=A0ABY1RG84_9MICO|nr:hypothetical protein SAMN06295909_3120 [Plantibacter sp. VKM Ac-1784]
MTGRWWSQPFAEEGSATADGILRQLGRPGLDELTVLVREAAQNSWDARIGTSIEFGVRIWRLADRHAAWADAMGSGVSQLSVDELGSVFQPDSYLICLSDRGTAGLGGPVRASVQPLPGEENDFVQFLRNVGEPRDTLLGGGTYGFGKGILYRVSRVNTILVDTQALVEGKVQRRVMAASLGQRFDSGGVRFTGRHWWGSIAEDGIPDPLIDDEAHHIGRILGLRGFDGDETGTDVYILGADFGVTVDEIDDDSVERSPEEAASFIASAISWNLWPKMVGDPEEIRFRVELEDKPVTIPSPSSDVQLLPFTRALQSLRLGRGQTYLRPKFGEVGRFAVESVVVPLGAEGSTDPAARAFQGASHHVARMRDTELVVDYLEGPVPSDVLLQYGAVFRASPEADEEFASAEPPTHDNWVEQGLAPPALAIVRGARHWIRGKLRSLYEPSGVEVDGIGGLGGLSSRLASLAPALEAGGAGWVSARTPNKGNAARRGGSIRVGPPKIEVRDQSAVVVSEVSLEVVDRQRRLTCVPSVVVDGSREGRAPAGLRAPRVLRWETCSGVALSSGDTLDVDASSPKCLIVVTELLPDAVTRIDVRESGLHA